jgi:hypothetical protein
MQLTTVTASRVRYPSCLASWTLVMLHQSFTPDMSTKYNGPSQHIHQLAASFCCCVRCS